MTADSPRRAWLRALERTTPFARGEGVTLPETVAAVAATAPERPALTDDSGTLSYGALAARIEGYAGWAAAALAPGEVAALLMGNGAEYLALWLGITRVRGVAALVNPLLVGEALRHALAAAPVRHVIAGPAQEAALAAVAPLLPPDIRLWSSDPGGRWPRPVGSAVPAIAATERRPRLSDLALYIYTSGTTGLPKAARVSHRRVAEWAQWFAGLIDVRPEDRMYNCLPMYHSVGGVVATGAMLAGGGSVLIRERFSATRFWDEVADGGCTLFQYIGELCRYLLRAPPHPREGAHGLRLCCGNGLRGDVWEAFRARFAIPRILEFYAATEGNVSLYNVEGKPGAIGRVPPFLAARAPVLLVRCDPESRALLRDEQGLCIRCDVDEAGEALGRIGGAEEGGRPFEGYTDDAASAAKVARDVLAVGDAWFRTGDLMRRDAAGFYYFVDRLGETFRWKGENVATEEVATVLRACPGVAEAVVYGVAVAGAEGRAGMAALTPGEGFDLAALHRHVTAALPAYARPLLLRVGLGIAATGTFKPATGQLVREGYDPAVVSDALYVDDRSAFVPLDVASLAGVLRV